jgi:hypothetical protein
MDVHRPEMTPLEFLAGVLAFFGGLGVAKAGGTQASAIAGCGAMLLVFVVLAYRGQRRHNAARRRALDELRSHAAEMHPDERAFWLDATRRELGGTGLKPMRRARRELEALPGGLGSPEGALPRRPRPRLPFPVEALVIVPAIGCAVLTPVVAGFGAEGPAIAVALTLVCGFVFIAVERRAQLHRISRGSTELWQVVSVLVTVFAFVAIGAAAFGLE